MSQSNRTGEKAFQSTSSINRFLRVCFDKLDTSAQSQYVKLAGVADATLGWVMRDSFTTTGPGAETLAASVPVRLASSQGTILAAADGAITAGATVYSGATGYITASAASNAYTIGVALETSVNAGDVIEIMPV
jgi:hypothetical protein